MKKILCVIFFVFSVSGIFSLEPVKNSDSSESARRRTALRCLELAKSYYAQKNYNAAVSQSQLGIAYYDGISDLYFILAQSQDALGAIKAKVLPIVKKSLDLNTWADYNRDNARLMYADLLCDTGRFREVEAILDEKPALFSSDSEYVRAKAYYRIGDEESILKARVKVEAARRIYPDDTRFPLLFFMYENPGETNPDAVRLSKYFCSQISQYVEASPDKDAELEIYASRFATGKDKTFLLKSFKARGLSHPLYAVSALEAGLISEADAFDYISSFADSEIDAEILETLLELLTKKDVIQTVKEYFISYAGIIHFDISGDRIPDLSVKYSRGRPQEAFLDINQDGEVDWTLVCDYGTPVMCSVFQPELPQAKTEVRWTEFPFVKEVNMTLPKDLRRVKFTLQGEALKWSPVDMRVSPLYAKKFALDFYVPYPLQVAPPDKFLLLSSSSFFEISSFEKMDAHIKFSILDNEIKEAVYSCNGKNYAIAFFEQNVPVMRLCDTDSDGIYETVESYGLDENESMDVHSLEDLRSITTNLFGVPADNAFFYLKSIQVDTNSDTVPDFTEEYYPHGKKIMWYDTDADGKWNVRHTKETDGSEEASFVELPSERVINVRTKDGNPVSVSQGDKTFSVEKDSLYNFFWIGKNTDEYSEDFYNECAKLSLLALSKNASRGYSVIVENEGTRLLAVKCGSLYFGKILPYADYGDKDGETQN